MAAAPVCPVSLHDCVWFSVNSVAAPQGNKPGPFELLLWRETKTRLLCPLNIPHCGRECYGSQRPYHSHACSNPSSAALAAIGHISTQRLPFLAGSAASHSFPPPPLSYPRRFPSSLRNE
jgi:hypothetical protein